MKKTFRITSTHPAQIKLKEKRIDINTICSYNELNQNTIPIVVLTGFGEYANSEYMNSLYKTFENQNIFLIAVDYIGVYTYIKLSKQELLEDTYLSNVKKIFSLNKKQKNDLTKKLIKIKNKPKKFDRILKDNNFIDNNISILDNLDKIDKILEQLELSTSDFDLNKIFNIFENIGFKKFLSDVTIQTKGEYQDFGLIQAIDVLTSIKFFRNMYKNIDWNRLSIVGTSHGAYVAQMVSKLAPNSVAKIVNNSSWTQSSELEMTNRANYLYKYDKLILNCTMAKEWSLKKSDKNYMSKDIRSIRDISKHISSQKKQTIQNNLPKYIFIHSLYDHLVKLTDKDEMVQNFIYEEFNLEYIRLDRKSKLDGNTFKELSHGAKASIKGLIYDFILKEDIKPITKDDFDLKSKIKYKTKNGKYTIDFSNKNYPKVTFKKRKKL
jgi:hypothetical protein